VTHRLIKQNSHAFSITVTTRFEIVNTVYVN